MEPVPGMVVSIVKCSFET